MKPAVFGAITSGLNEARSSGVRETSLASIPTDSATGGQTSNQQPSQPSGQQTLTQNQTSSTQQSNNGLKPVAPATQENNVVTVDQEGAAALQEVIH